MEETSDERDAVAVLRVFFTRMHEWETQCWRWAREELKFTTPGREAHEHIKRTRNAVLADLAVPEAAESPLSTGSPTQYDPRREEVVETRVVRAGAEVEVVTECRVRRDKFHFGSKWRYRLVRDGERWVVAGRWDKHPTDARFERRPLI